MRVLIGPHTAAELIVSRQAHANVSHPLFVHTSACPRPDTIRRHQAIHYRRSRSCRRLEREYTCVFIPQQGQCIFGHLPPHVPDPLIQVVCQVRGIHHLPLRQSMIIFCIQHFFYPRIDIFLLLLLSCFCFVVFRLVVC